LNPFQSLFYKGTALSQGFPYVPRRRRYADDAMSAKTPEVGCLSQIQSRITTKKRPLPCKAKLFESKMQLLLREKECSVGNIMRTDENPPGEAQRAISMLFVAVAL